MTNKPSKPINLFDVQASQKVIGQENFLKAFEIILNHGGYAQGPECRELDEKLAAYSGTKYCSTCGSGTDALTLALMAWDVKAGDAVFVSSFTFVASAECVAIVALRRFLSTPTPIRSIWIRKIWKKQSPMLRKRAN